jgi:hypothetical protein
MQGISTAIVIVRVEMGISFDADNKTSGTVMHFASSASTTTPHNPERSSKYIVD